MYGLTYCLYARHLALWTCSARLGSGANGLPLVTLHVIPDVHTTNPRQLVNRCRCRPPNGRASPLYISRSFRFPLFAANTRKIMQIALHFQICSLRPSYASRLVKQGTTRDAATMVRPGLHTRHMHNSGHNMHCLLSINNSPYNRNSMLAPCLKPCSLQMPHMHTTIPCSLHTQSQYPLIASSSLACGSVTPYNYPNPQSTL